MDGKVNDAGLDARLRAFPFFEIGLVLDLTRLRELESTERNGVATTNAPKIRMTRMAKNLGLI
jgi:hypothetical protein